MEKKIPFNIVVQNPSELVVVLSDTVHAGFNLGPNVATAVNYVDQSWLSFEQTLGLGIFSCDCKINHNHFSVRN